MPRKNNRMSWAEIFGQLPRHKRPKRSGINISIRDQVLMRDHNRCQHPGCGRTDIELHHIVFRSHQGLNDVENLVSLCIEHHHGNDGPHLNIERRRFWEAWSQEKYPEYWNFRRESV